jgi:hypothetical protein
MTTSRYKDLVILLLLGVIVILLFRFNGLNNHLAMLESDLVNEQAMHESDTKIFKQDMQAFEDSLQEIKSSKSKEVVKWKQSPPTERIKYVSLIDSNSTITDSTVCFTLSGVDSIQAIAIGLKYCVQENVIKDGIITTQGDKISKDSAYISLQKNALKTQRKAARIRLIKTALLSGVVGVIVGLVL